MNKRVWIGLLALLWAGSSGLVWAAPAPREAKAAKQGTQDVHHYLPKGSRIVISVADFKQLMKGLRKTPLYGLLKEPELAPLVKSLTNRLLGSRMYYDYRSRKMRKRKNMWDRAQDLSKQLTGFTLSQAATIFRGPHALAIVGVPRGSSPLELAGAFGVDDPKKAWSLLHTLLHRVPIRKSRYTYKGIQVNVLRGLENQFHYALHGHRVLIGTTKRVMQKMLDNGHGGSDHLGQDQGFQQFLKRTSLTHGARLYVAADSLLQDLAANIGTSRDAFLKVLGLKSWKSLGLAMGFQGKRFHTRFALRFQKGAAVKGPNRLLALPPADTSLLKTLPERAIVATLVRIPWTKLWDDAMAILKKTRPRQHQRYMLNLGRIERAILGMPVRDILESIGENSAFYLYPYAGGGIIPQLTLVAKLKHPDSIKGLISRLAKQLNFKIKQDTYRKTSISTLHFQRMSYRAVRKLPRSVRPLAYTMMGLGGKQLCYAFVGKQLWLALTPQTMKNFIDQQKQTPSAAHKQLQASLIKQAKGAGAFGHMDIKQAFAPLYNTLLGASPFIGNNLALRMLLGRRRSSFAGALPRTRVFLRHMHPATGLTRHANQDTQIQLRSGLGLEWMAIGAILVPTARKLFFQFRIRDYIRSMVAFLRLEERSKKYKAQGLYKLAIRQWKSYSRSAITDAVRLSANDYVKKFEALANARHKAIVAGLQKQYKAQQVSIQEWRLFGDWQYKDGVLQAVEHKSNGPSVYFGADRLSTYILQFEVLSPSEGFNLSLHTRPNVLAKGYGSQYTSYRNARRIYFSKRRFQKGKWVPVKIKVKGKRISYWFGLKHYRTRAFPKHGKIGFVVPAGGSFALRNLKIEEEKSKTPAVAKKLYPSLQLSLVSAASSIETGDAASFRLTIHNQGQLPAKQLVIRLQLSKHVAFRSATARPALTRAVKETNGSLTFKPIGALEGGQTLRLRINVRGKQAGSALAMAAIKFAQMQGEISLSARLHVTPDPSKAAAAASPTKTAQASPKANAFGVARQALRGRRGTRARGTRTATRTNTRGTRTAKTRAYGTRGTARANRARTNTRNTRTARTAKARGTRDTRTRGARNRGTNARNLLYGTRSGRGTRAARRARGVRGIGGRRGAIHNRRRWGHAGIRRKRRRVPRIVTRSPAIYGSLDRRIIQRIIRQNQRRFRYCYERQLIKNPRLQGRVNVYFQINARGRVSLAKIKRNTIRSRRFERCMLRAVRGMRFPNPRGGGIVLVNYPFLFRTN